jgi:flavodoxin
MKIVVIYDSVYGNCERVAKALAKVLEEKGEVRLVKAVDAPTVFSGVSWLIAGTPTHGGGLTEGMRQFWQKVPADALKGIKVAAFDTRSNPAKQGWFLKLLAKVLGHAAPKLAKILQDKGGELNGGPAGFAVESKEGPLADGELDRAREWVRELVN